MDTHADMGVAEVIARLKPRFGSRLILSEAIRQHHGRGEGLEMTAPPDAVVYPDTNEEVATIVGTCNEFGVPVIPFGVGTSLEGHVAATQGGVCIDLSQMNAVLEVNAEDLDCRVQAGITRTGVNHHLRDQGLFFPVDPGADATIGGMAATRASGTNAVRYGTMREVVLGLTVVTPKGEIIHTGGRARKSAAGYDLTRLYIGSEGTLGVITEVQLRLFGIPDEIAAATCQFDQLENAVNVVILAMQMGIPLARIELLDDVAMGASIRHSDLKGLDDKPTLFFEFHGTKASVAEQIEQLQQITQEFGGGEYLWAINAEDRNRLWSARHNAYYAGKSLAPGKHGFSTDSCVPISALSDCISDARALANESGLISGMVGHVGDGNFHVLILFDPESKDERQKAEDLAAAISSLAISYGGTCTGEHGIGLHKMDALREEHGAAVDIMHDIKKALDPKNIMNPDKIFYGKAPGADA